MKPLMILTVGFCLLFSAVPAMADQAADEAAVRKVVEQEVADYNKHDAKAVNAAFVENWENWDGTTKGRTAAEKHSEEYFEGRAKNVQLKDEEIGIIFVTPEVAIYKSRGEFTNLLDEDGKPLPPEKGLHAAVYVKSNAKWLVAASF